MFMVCVLGFNCILLWLFSFVQWKHITLTSELINHYISILAFTHFSQYMIVRLIFQHKMVYDMVHCITKLC